MDRYRDFLAKKKISIPTGRDSERGVMRGVSGLMRMDFTKKTAVTWIALTLTGFPLIAGCAGPRWTGLSDIKRREMAPEHDTVRITSQPPGARVFVQEKLVGLTPLSVELSFRRAKCYRENVLMDGDEILERKRLDHGMEYIPEYYDIKIYKRGYTAHFFKHKGDNQDGRYSATIVLQGE